MKSSFYCSLALLCALIPFATSLQCLDEGGHAVDWWIVMKFPILKHSQDANAQSGFGYAYGDSNSLDISVTSYRLDENLSGSLGSTLSQIYNADTTSVAWVMYNDQTPDNKEHESYGHTKGTLAYDSQAGFWLVHSIPRFPYPSSAGSYTFPDNEKDYGQSLICVSLDISQFDDVFTQLQHTRPYVYDSNAPTSLASLAPRLGDVLNGTWVTSPTTNTVTIKSLQNFPFTYFAKTSAWNNDLYQNYVQEYYGVDLWIETWMNGALSDKMPTFCTPTYSYDSINVRNVTFNGDISFPETKDHSKWAISLNNQVGPQSLVCIGGINRQFSQYKRAGGTLCFESISIWKTFYSMIAGADSC